MPHSIDPEEVEENWVATCNMTVSLAEMLYPPRPPLKRDHGLTSKSLYPFLDTILEFCQVLDEVEFQVPKHGERADNPLEVYFTCYEVHLLRCC